MSPQQVFHALGDPTRLAVIDRLALGPARVTDLAGPFSMSLPSFMRHLDILESSGVITSEKVGRVRTCQLQVNVLNNAQKWLSDRRAVWTGRLDRLAIEIGDNPASTEGHAS